MKKLGFYGLIISTIIIFCIILFTPIHSTLVFYERNTDHITAYLPVHSEQHFQITFVHSIHLTDVVEKYVITDEGNIKQYEMIFEQFGIGMPSTIEEGEEMVFEDGKYHIRNMNNIFESFNIRNGKTVSKHRLSWKGSDDELYTVFFNDYFEPGNWYKVKVEKLSYFRLWKEVKIHD